jgi:formylmethanofuran dehydrogenase subunit E
MDAYDLWLRKEAEDERWLSSRPVCDRCGEPIQEDGYYDIDGEKWCRACVEGAWQRIREDDY